uniref:Aromatic amino acid beta-eliminating lyase/threonine aldolase domain-containing protein n=1 Tax=Periophthalmus magnuspinnatus TaxID=409849 RepID=A0A3B3ZUV3_9GOBI
MTFRCITECLSSSRWCKCCAGARVVDLRSDTVTRPGAEMRKVMKEAEVGDDVMGQDPSVNDLQTSAAHMFGMEAALFVPSGTMSNLIAVMVHCRERGDEMIVGDLSHLHIYEQGGSAQLAGVHSTSVTTLPDGTFDLDQLESKIRHGFPDPHYPRSRLICVENTHNIQGGRVLPLSFLQEVRSLADKYDLKVHMDGARVMNAAVALGVSIKTILQHTHTVSVCLSKGLGSPVGTVLSGPSEFISRAVRCRKALGGGMRQAGILAAAGKMSLVKMASRLEEDHRNAKTFARGLGYLHVFRRDKSLTPLLRIHFKVLSTINVVVGVIKLKAPVCNFLVVERQLHESIEIKS